MTDDAHREFMAAIDFAADEAGQEAALFLQMWREGCWPEIQRDFPKFKGPFPGVDLLKQPEGPLETPRQAA